jgi:uncharacterized protein (DUF433 family)
VEERQLGLSDEQIRTTFEAPLTQADLDAAWEYYEGNRHEIAQNLWENTVCMIEHAGNVPAWLLVRGRQLGFTDEQIREAFYPPLAQAVLDATWTEYEQNPEPIEQAIRDRAED